MITTLTGIGIVLATLVGVIWAEARTSTITHDRRPDMQIDKAQIIDLLKSRGDHDQAKQAESQLPDKVDTEKDKGLLDKFGIDLNDLAGKIPGLGGLGL
ncbi:MAG: hypothetical protein ABI873_07300 [Marmoricola sp.]